MHNKIGNFRSFFAFNPLKKTPKSKFLKMKKFDGDIILHMCTKNHNHMILGSGKTKWHKQNFLSFWAIFYPFTPAPSPSPLLYIHVYQKIKKNQDFKIEKNIWRYYHFTHVHYKWHHMMYDPWDMEHNRQNLSFWTIFALSDC